jgi:hypothetical protein
MTTHEASSQTPGRGPAPTQYIPLAERIRDEIVALHDRRNHATSRREVREFTTWIDEAYGELNRAMKLEALVRNGPPSQDSSPAGEGCITSIPRAPSRRTLSGILRR